MKAVIIFDAPESCRLCPLRASLQQYAGDPLPDTWCSLTLDDVYIEPGNYKDAGIHRYKRAANCPLKLVDEDTSTQVALVNTY